MCVLLRCVFAARAFYRVPLVLGSDKISDSTASNGKNENTAMSILAPILLTLVLAVSWLAQLVGLPGNWLIVIAVAIYAWALPEESGASIGWYVVIALVVLALLAEAAELAAGALGVSRAGAAAAARYWQLSDRSSEPSWARSSDCQSQS